jgi:NAD(P)-dependent dehydrogenase (short-subunit alcohol dehydrogenase family)
MAVPGTGRVAGRTALVMGAGQTPGQTTGNGRATAVLLAREGAKVLCADRDLGAAEETVKQIADEGGEAIAISADVTVEDEVAAAVAACAQQWGRLDILHNNVGTGGRGGTAETVDLEGWGRIIETNLTSALLCCRFCIPRMLANGGGAIVNVSSLAGTIGLAGAQGAVAYTASKAGLQGLTLSIAADYATKGIRANALIVGTVNTPLVARLGPEGRERRRQMVPMQTEGTAWDVAYAAVYLASDEARWITGVMLPIDGGLLAIRQWPR